MWILGIKLSQSLDKFSHIGDNCIIIKEKHGNIRNNKYSLIAIKLNQIWDKARYIGDQCCKICEMRLRKVKAYFKQILLYSRQI